MFRPPSGKLTAVGTDRQAWRELFCSCKAIAALGGVRSALESPNAAGEPGAALEAAQRAMAEADEGCIMGLPVAVGRPLCAAIELAVTRLAAAHPSRLALADTTCGERHGVPGASALVRPRCTAVGAAAARAHLHSMR